MGIKARSWMGWQVPIQHLRRARLGPHRRRARHRNERAAMARGEVAVVAGFQGVAPGSRISTLGRGGSDTARWRWPPASRPTAATSTPTSTASTPPIRASCPRRGGWKRSPIEEMLEMASLGAKVLQTRSVEIAMLHRVPTRVLSTFTPDAGGTLLCDEEDIVEKKPVTGIAYSRDEAKITLHKIPDRPGIAAAIFGPLADAGVNVDMIVQNVSEDGKQDRPHLHRARAASWRARWRRSRPMAKPRSAIATSPTTPTSPRSRSSASACAPIPAWPRPCSARCRTRASTSR